jgi:hypothetical protein
MRPPTQKAEWRRDGVENKTNQKEGAKAIAMPTEYLKRTCKTCGITSLSEAPKAQMQGGKYLFSWVVVL